MPISADNATADNLSSAEPDVEVLLAEVAGGRTVRLYIDHPDGVSLGLCEQAREQQVVVPAELVQRP